MEVPRIVLTKNDNPDVVMALPQPAPQFDASIPRASAEPLTDATTSIPGSPSSKVVIIDRSTGSFST